MIGVPASVPSDDPPVLVADDDPYVRTMLRTLLELDGHEVVEARNGEEAWHQRGYDEYFLKTDPLPKLRDKVREYAGARPP